MKATRKIFLTFLTAFLLLTALVSVSLAAEPAQSVEIVSQNLYYGERLQMMYAVDAPDGAEITVRVYSDAQCQNLVYEATPGEDGVDYGTDKAVFFGVGVPAQKIDTQFYAKAYADGKEIGRAHV